MSVFSPGEFIPTSTSIADYLLKRLTRVHLDREIGAFAGPPGIGKTTAAQLMKAEYGNDVALVTPRQMGTKAVLGINLVLSAIRTLAEMNTSYLVTSKSYVERSLDYTIEKWAWVQTNGRLGHDGPHLTIIFDEAQRFHESFFETIRSWNDSSWSDRFPRIGLVFMGNTDFIIESGAQGPSFLTPAVTSRTAYLKTFTYSDILDEDIELVVRKNGLNDTGAVDAMLDFCRTASRNRDLRVVLRVLREARREAGDGDITAGHIYNVVGLTTEQAANAPSRRRRSSPALNG